MSNWWALRLAVERAFLKLSDWLIGAKKPPQVKETKKSKP